MPEVFRITLEAARVNANLTQKEAANKMGTTIQTIWSWEKGKTKPQIDQAEKLCLIYGVPISCIKWNSDFLPSRSN